MEEEKLSKKEKRALAKEEKKKARESQEKASNLKKYAIIAIALVVIGWLGYQSYKFVTAPAPEIITKPVEVYESDHIRGENNASATLIEYGDFQCPACAQYKPMVEEVLAGFPDSVRLVYRHFPLTQIHKNAYVAAKASEAAGNQGKFWEMHDILFDKQNDWANEVNPEGKFQEYAREIGLDMDKFLEDYKGGDFEEKINADIASGNQLGANSTPTFFLNGKRITPRDLGEFADLINQELQN